MTTVLVIDDSRSILEFIRQTLSEAGYRALTTMDGKAAITLLKKETVDLVVTDMYMPDRDGIEVIQDIRRVSPAMPVIAMSSKTGPYNLFPVAKALGATVTLQKPFKADDFLRTVKNVLANSRQPVTSQPPNSRS